MGNKQRVQMEGVMLCGCHGNRDGTGQCEHHQPGRGLGRRSKGKWTDSTHCSCRPLCSMATSSKAAQEGQADRCPQTKGAGREGRLPRPPPDNSDVSLGLPKA